jgi:hypothetical protein
MTYFIAKKNTVENEIQFKAHSRCHKQMTFKGRFAPRSIQTKRIDFSSYQWYSNGDFLMNSVLYEAGKSLIK